MNKSRQFMWMHSAVALFFVCFCASFFCVGCSEGNLTGTSEDPNEIVAEGSSSSGEPDVSSSDSKEVDDVSSSSTKDEKSSSSEPGKNITRSSSSREPTKTISSSSSDEPDVVPMPVSSSSDGGNSKTPIESSGDNSLGYYLHLFNLEGDGFDSNVLATTFGNVVDGDTEQDPPPGTGPHRAEATEFDAPEKVHRFVKQNVGALKSLFPETFKQYSELVSAIQNGTADESCGLYMLNLYGDKYAGHVLAEITSRKLTVLDVDADGCQQKSGGLVRFLFKFCGEIDERPEIERIVVTGDLSGQSCLALSGSDEWVKN